MTETITVVGGGGTLVVSSLGPATTRLFTGAGSSGLVPDPGAGDADRVLLADGTWAAQSGGGGGGGGAPTDAQYLVAASNSTLSAERVLSGESGVVGVDFTTPGAAVVSLVAGGVANSKLASAAQATLKGRAAGAGTGAPTDLTAAQARTLLNVEDGAAADQSAAEVPFSPTGGLSATNVQAALAELDTEKAAAGHTHSDATTSVAGFMSAADKTKLNGVESGATADQVASEVPFTPTGGVAASNVQAAIAELDTDKAAAAHTHVTADVTGLDAALAGKAASTHSHAISDVTGLQTALDAKLSGPVSNANLADVATSTIKGRVTAGTGDPEDLTATQVRTLLNVENGATADQVASEVPFTPAGGLAATNVQAALEELDTEKSATGHTHSDATTSVAGFMSAADKTKLDDVEASANNYVHPNHTGDVTSTGDGATAIADGVVTNAKLADMATATVKARVAGSTGAPSDVGLATLDDLLNAEATVQLDTNQSFSSNTYSVLLDWDDTRLPSAWFTHDPATGEFTVVQKCRVSLRVNISLVLATAGSATFQMHLAKETSPGVYTEVNGFIATQLVLSTLDGAANCALDVSFLANAGDVYVIEGRRTAGSQTLNTKMAWCFLTLSAHLRA